MGLLNKFRKEGSKKDYQQEIVENLTAIFNTKQTFGAWQRGLGLKSYCNGKSRNDLIEEIVLDVKTNIEQFEKRVQLIDIKVVDNKGLFNLNLQINCRAGGQFHAFYLGFKRFEDLIEVGTEN